MCVLSAAIVAVRSSEIELAVFRGYCARWLVVLIFGCWDFDGRTQGELILRTNN